MKKPFDLCRNRSGATVSHELAQIIEQLATQSWELILLDHDM
jgi:hypothetical protein